MLLHETGRANIDSLAHNEIQYLEFFDSINAIREAGIEALGKRYLGRDADANIQFLSTPSREGLGFVNDKKSNSVGFLN